MRQLEVQPAGLIDSLEVHQERPGAEVLHHYVVLAGVAATATSAHFHAQSSGGTCNARLKQEVTVAAVSVSRLIRRTARWAGAPELHCRLGRTLSYHGRVLLRAGARDDLKHQ